jgi:tripartite-type tricarboxylate transporter receptor subunit TctC
MTLPRRRFLHLAAGVAALSGVTRVASAQAYPSRSITMVVPVSAGGAMDTLARIVAEGMRASLGQPVIVENMTGASGTIGVGRVARAAPDGYTLSYAAFATHVISAAVYPLPYDVLEDFASVALISRTPWLIAAKNDFPANSLRDLIVWLKAHPDKASAGTAGAGSPGHLGGVLLQQMTGTRFQFVPYRGNLPAIQDLVSGQIDMMIVDPITCIPQLRAGRIKVFAVMAKSRTTNAPDIPTVDEAGSPDLHIAPWQAIWVPKGTPNNIITKLNEAVVNALADPTTRRKFADQGYEIGPRAEQTPEYLRAFHKSEIDKWWPIIKAAGIKGA